MFESLDGIAQPADAKITVIAENAPDYSGPMVVIYDKIFI